MRVVILIQARMSSTRLPGKVVREINGLPLLWHIYRRLLACREADDVAVSAAYHHDLAHLCDSVPMKSWSSTDDESDLIRRHLKTGRRMGADAIVRVTTDCLFHDPALIDAMIREYRASYPRYRGLSNSPFRAHSEGVDCDIWSMELLAELDRTPECPRENWASWAIANGPKYGVRQMHAIYVDAPNPGDPHLSIDTEDDVRRAEAMLKLLGNDEWRYEKTMEAYHAVTR